MRTSTRTHAAQVIVPDRAVPETVLRNRWKAAEIRRIVADLTAGRVESLEAEFRLIDLGIDHHAAELLVDDCHAAANRTGGAW